MVIKMNENLICIQISKFRKAAGMTQEGLGVTIDALFGRDGSERVDVEDVVGSWLCSFPKKERLSRLCRLVWASVKHLLDDGLGIPEMGYLETCLPDMGDGLNRLMLS